MGANGSQIWSSDEGASIYATKTVTQPGLAGWGGGGSINLFQPQDGSQIASARAGGEVQCQPIWVNVSGNASGFAIASQIKNGGVTVSPVNSLTETQNNNKIQGNASGCLAVNNDAKGGAYHLYTSSSEGFLLALNPDDLSQWYIDNSGKPPVAVTNQLTVYKGFVGQTTIYAGTNSSKLRAYADNGQGITNLGDYDVGGIIKVAVATQEINRQVYVHAITETGKVSSYSAVQGQLTKMYDYQVPGNKKYTIYPVMASHQQFFVTSDDGVATHFSFDGQGASVGGDKRIPSRPGMWAGIAIAAVAFILIVCFIAFKINRCCKNRRTKKMEKQFMAQQAKKEKEFKENEEKQRLEKKESTNIGVARSLNGENLRSFNEIHNSARDIENVGELKARLGNSQRDKQSVAPTSTEAPKEVNPPPRYGSSINKARKMLDDNSEVYTRNKPGTSHNSLVNSMQPVNVMNSSREKEDKESQRKLLKSHDSINNNSQDLGEKGPLIKKSEEEKQRKTQTQDSQNLDNFDLATDMDKVQTKDAYNKNVDNSVEDPKVVQNLLAKEKQSQVDGKQKGRENQNDFNNMAEYVKEQAKNKKNAEQRGQRMKQSDLDLINADIERNGYKDQEYRSGGRPNKDSQSNSSLDFIRQSQLKNQELAHSGNYRNSPSTYRKSSPADKRSDSAGHYRGSYPQTPGTYRESNYSYYDQTPHDYDSYHQYEKSHRPPGSRSKGHYNDSDYYSQDYGHSHSPRLSPPPPQYIHGTYRDEYPPRGSYPYDAYGYRV